MPFDISTWKQQIANKMPGVQARLKSSGVNTLYYFLATTSLIPLIHALQNGDQAALVTLSGILAGAVSTNLLSNVVQKLKDRSDEEIIQSLQKEISNTPGLKNEINILLEKLDALNQITMSLSDEDKTWFTRAIQDELENHSISNDDKSWFIKTIRDELKNLNKGISILGNVTHSIVVTGSGNQINYQPPSTSLQPTEYRLFGVPNLPDIFLPRDNEMQRMIDLLKQPDGNGRVAITGCSLRVGVLGMGGVGKSVLAATVAHNHQVKELFPDGVFWITVSHDPDLDNLQAILGKAIGDPGLPYHSLQEGKACLSEALKNKKFLLILDDIWNEEHAEAFDLTINRGCLLLTSRNLQAMETFQARVYQLGVLNESDSLDLLSKWAGYELPTIPPVAKLIVKECGYLPLAVAMAGALVKDQDWNYVLDCLTRLDLVEFTRRFPYDHPNLLRAIQVSIENLPEKYRKLYMDFAVFPEDTAIPSVALETLWATSTLDKKENEIETKRAIKFLANRSLLLKDQNGNVTLHDLLMDYIRKGIDLKPLNRKIVNAYRNSCSNGWHTGPNDGYFIQHIAWHLNNADLHQELHSMMVNYQWIKKKIAVGEINSIIFEYNLINNDDDHSLWLIQSVLRMAKHILSKDICQLPSQLIGRLSIFKQQSITSLLEDASKEDSWPWLMPITSSLTPPGFGELMTLEGHDSGVRAVVVLSNGKQAISASEDKTIKIWDLEDGRCLRTFNISDQSIPKTQGDGNDRGGYINSLLLLRDQKHLLSAMHDSTIKIWNLENGACVKTFEGHTERVYTIALTADEKRLISGAGDNFVKIWDMETGNCIHSLAHTAPIRTIVFSTNEEQILSGSEDGTIKFWLRDSGKLITTINNCGNLRSMTVSSKSNKLFYAGKEGTISIFNLTTGNLDAEFKGHNHLIRCVRSVNNDNNEFIISTSNDHTIKVWNTDKTCLNIFEGHSKSVNCIAQIPSDNKNQSANSIRLISGSEDGKLKIWDLTSRDLQKFINNRPSTHRHKGPVKILTFVAGGKKLVSASQDGVLNCWETESGEYVGEVSKHKKAINSVKVTSDGNTIFSGGDKKVIGFDIKGNKKFLSVLKTGTIQALEIVPNTKKIILAVQRSGFYEPSSLEILNVDNLKTKNLIGDVGAVHLLCITQDGKRLISCTRSRGKEIKIWDLKTCLCINTIKAHHRFVLSMVLTPDGKQIVTSLWNGQIKIWNIEDGKCLHILEGHTESAHSLAITPDGKKIVSGSWDKTLRTWNIETGEPTQIFTGHSDIINAFSISANGKYLASVANDNTLKVWNLSNGQCLFTYWADAPMYTTIISHLSNTIIAGDQKGKIHFLRTNAATINDI